jgi:hypothetical protein
MERPPKLPLPLEELPQSIRRFCDASGPAPARMMAARGTVPVGGMDLVTMLVQLTADPDKGVKSAAADTLAGLPENVLFPACEGKLHASILDGLADNFWDHDEAALRIVANDVTADWTIERVARRASEQVCERIAVNERRLLAAPEIIEALYKNRNTRMSTADRLVELASRNGITFESIPAFQMHAEAIQDQLIPEPSEEPLPTDALFEEVLSFDGDNVAFEIDDKTGEEEMTDEGKPLSMRIKDMSQGEKIRLAIIGSAGARALLVRDTDKTVAYAAISSPSVTAEDAAAIAGSREVDANILRFIGNKREWTKSMEVKRALIFNPKAPVGIAVKFISHLRLQDLKKLSRSREVPGQVKSVAYQWLDRRSKN